MAEPEPTPAVPGAPDGYVPDDPDTARRRLHLVVLAALAATAGWVDAVVFTTIVPTFVANQSGNVVLVGIGAGQGRWLDTAAAGLSIGGFAAGLALSTAYRDRRLAAGRQLEPLVVLGVETALLAALAGLAATGPGRVDAVDGRVLVTVAAGALAMGVQTTILRRVWGVQVSTTYTSGEVARLSEVEVAAADGTGPARDRRAVVVLTTGVVAYAVGAAGAAWMGGSVAPLLVPPAVTASVGVVLHLDHRRHPPMAADPGL